MQQRNPAIVGRCFGQRRSRSVCVSSRLLLNVCCWREASKRAGGRVNERAKSNANGVNAVASSTWCSLALSHQRCPNTLALSDQTRNGRRRRRLIAAAVWLVGGRRLISQQPDCYALCCVFTARPTHTLRFVRRSQAAPPLVVKHGRRWRSIFALLRAPLHWCAQLSAKIQTLYFGL